MTADHSSHAVPDEPITVVVDLGGTPDEAPVLELRGPLDARRLQAALDRIDRIAARPPEAGGRHHSLQRHGPGHHTLRLSADAPAGLLADLLTHASSAGPLVRRIEPSPLQRELIADADARSGAGRHCEQLAFVWHGPFDHERFTAAWASVFAHETVLRAAFEEGPEPHIVLHERVVPEVVRLPHGGADWSALVEADRRRGLDPHRPGPLRITVLGGAAHSLEAAEPTRVLLTFHHGLLDSYSVRLLLHEFYRAYLADGTLPGGERRPDIGDYTHWVAAQDTAAAREFWRGCPLTPATALPVTGTGSGTGHTRARLTPRQADRLVAWAANWGVPESSVLHAVWAMLLYRAAEATGPTAVGFSSTVSGRGILLDGIERLPAALRNPLPMTVEVDPHATVPAFLARLRDQAIDLAAYEWVSAGQIRSWTGQPDVGHTGSLLVFDHHPSTPEAIAPHLAEHGIHVGFPETLGVGTAFPVTLVAHHDDEGLALTVSYDRGHFADADEVLAHTVLLLRELPCAAGETTTVGEMLGLLADIRLTAPSAPPRTTAAHAEPSLDVLRSARRPGAGTVCLIGKPGTSRLAHARVAAVYDGPEALVLLGQSPETGAGRDAALRMLDAVDGPLVFGAFSGGGVAAYELAQAVVARGGMPPVVVLTAAAASAVEFARTLAAAARRPR
ncbi:condensation domain-containing protein [Streptomyces monashensis]|nr:condensation domain-containing protein [Streptomyces monashensis]